MLFQLVNGERVLFVGETWGTYQCTSQFVTAKDTCLLSYSGWITPFLDVLHVWNIHLRYHKFMVNVGEYSLHGMEIGAYGCYFYLTLF